MRSTFRIIALSCIALLFASAALAATAGVVPACIEVGPANVVPVYEAPAGIGVVPIEIFPNAAAAGGTCMPIRVVVQGSEIATPVNVVGGSLGDNVLMETGDDLLMETGDMVLIEG